MYVHRLGRLLRGIEIHGNIFRGLSNTVDMIRVEITSYNSYEWTSELSTGETCLSSGEMHLIKDT